MSRIDELIERLCPDGVEHKALGEVGTFTRGSGIQKKDFVDEGIGCIHYGQIYTSYGLFADKTLSFISPDFAKGKRMAKSGDLVIATTSENEEDVCKAVAWLGDEEIAVSNDAYIYSHSLNPKYMAYFFQSDLFQTQKAPYITGTKVLRVSGDSMAKFRIPVPPMEIQEEIVRILDSFSELEAELEAELGARTQQYGYYRDRFVDSPLIDAQNIASISLGNICEKPMYGSGAKAVDGNPASDIRYIRITDITENGTLGHDWKTASSVDQKYLLKQGDILFARSGATAGKTIQYDIAMGKAIFAGYLIRFRVNSEEFLPRFVYHCVNSTRYWTWLDHVKGGGAQPNVSAKDYASFLIPALPLEEQHRIVTILDKFDALVNDLSSGIPAEIEARRKQYEYYRDKLLTFKEKPGD